MKKTVKTKITSISKDFRGEGQYDGKKVVTDGVISEESVEVEINGIRDSVMYGRAVKIIEASSKRVQPLCPYFYKCGKCALQFMDYSEQLKIKKQIVANAVTSIAPKARIFDCEGIYYPYRYRNKTSMLFSHDKDRIVIGYENDVTHKIIDVEDCPVCDKWIIPLLSSLRAFAGKYKMRAYNPVTGEGVLKGFSALYLNNKLCVSLYTTIDKVIGAAWLLKELNTIFPQASLWIFSDGFDSGAPSSICVSKEKSPEVDYFGEKRRLEPDLLLPHNEKLMRRLIKEIKDNSMISCSNQSKGILSEFTFENDIEKGRSLISDDAEGLAKALYDTKPDRVLFYAENRPSMEKALDTALKQGFYPRSATPYDMLPQTKQVSALIIFE